MKMKNCLFTLAALLSFTIANAQTVDEIIAKHVDAVGGKDKLAQVNSVYIESTTEVMGNQSATKTYILNGKGYRNESDFNSKLVCCQRINEVTKLIAKPAMVKQTN